MKSLGKTSTEQIYNFGVALPSKTNQRSREFSGLRVDNSKIDATKPCFVRSDLFF
jgi:hypothetical protein